MDPPARRLLLKKPRCVAETEPRNAAFWLLAGTNGGHYSARWFWPQRQIISHSLQHLYQEVLLCMIMFWNICIVRNTEYNSHCQAVIDTHMVMLPPSPKTQWLTVIQVRRQETKSHDSPEKEAIRCEGITHLPLGDDS